VGPRAGIDDVLERVALLREQGGDRLGERYPGEVERHPARRRAGHRKVEAGLAGEPLEHRELERVAHREPHVPVRDFDEIGVGRESTG